MAYSKNDFDIYLLIFRLKVDFILLLLKIYIHYVPQIIFFSWIIGEHISNTYFRFTNTVLPPFVIFDSMLLETICVRTGFFSFEINCFHLMVGIRLTIAKLFILILQIDTKYQQINEEKNANRKEAMNIRISKQSAAPPYRGEKQLHSIYRKTCSVYNNKRV